MRPFTALWLTLMMAVSCQAFVPSTPTLLRQPASVLRLQSTTESSTTSSSPTDTADDDAMTDKGLLKRDRYIATNRFAVRRDQQAKFEQRWATRKSRLAELDGFRYFHLMRRVQLRDDGSTVYDGGDSDSSAMENYVSFTVWDKKSAFSAWRKGDAFKEAHGGTSIGAFLSTMVNSALVLRGAPRPAFYDGLATKSTVPESLPETVDGWRNVPADGMNVLPAESFVCLEKYYIPQSEAAEFEQQWESQDWLVLNSLMRRDGQAKGHGVAEVDSSEPTYVASYVFPDRASLDQWLHSADKAVERVFYEATLVINTPQGA